MVNTKSNGEIIQPVANSALSQLNAVYMLTNHPLNWMIHMGLYKHTSNQTLPVTFMLEFTSTTGPDPLSRAAAITL